MSLPGRIVCHFNRYCSVVNVSSPGHLSRELESGEIISEITLSACLESGRAELRLYDQLQYGVITSEAEGRASFR